MQATSHAVPRTQTVDNISQSARDFVAGHAAFSAEYRSSLDAMRALKAKPEASPLDVLTDKVATSLNALPLERALEVIEAFASRNTDFPASDTLYAGCDEMREALREEQALFQGDRL